MFGQTRDVQTAPNIVLINRNVTKVGEERQLGLEGCLSIPSLQCLVPRWSRIRYHGTNIEGEHVEGGATGIPPGSSNTKWITSTVSSFPRVYIAPYPAIMTAG